MVNKENNRQKKSLPNTNHKTSLSVTQKTIIIVIVLAIAVTLATVVMSFFLQPERLTKARIESLASDYYENYLYESFISSENFSGDLESAMSKYAELGFASISLRQLILHDQEKSNSVADSIRANCDIERTTIRFYPESPFSRKDYHIDYRYVCNF